MSTDSYRCAHRRIAAPRGGSHSSLSENFHEVSTMRFAQSIFFLVAAVLALAVGSVRAEDKIGKDANDPGFNALDKDNDGYISRAEAMGNTSLAKKFKQADKNGDGKLSRAEYLA